AWVGWPRDGAETLAVLYEWIDGARASKASGGVVSRELGVATRALHEHGRTWRPPVVAEIHPTSDVFYGKPDLLSAICDAGVIAEAAARAHAVLARLAKEEPQPLHSDLHLENAIWTREGLAIIDFDDMTMGWPLLDPAISFFYLRRMEGAEEREACFWEGYGGSVEDLGGTQEELEALVAGRGLLLANELLTIRTQDLRDIALGYAEVTEKRLRHYLTVGRFDPNVASLPD
ncbi:MAG TPA: phosphotransferase, partial [Fimbriimonadaceae bacterium]|nr:phosphotransferase [Fimbriimonadaceae bacterium]